MQAITEEREPETASPPPEGSSLTIDVVGPDGRRFALQSLFSGYSEAPEDREQLAELLGNWSVARGRAQYSRLRSEGRRLSLPKRLPPFEMDVTLFAMTRDGQLRGTLDLAAGEVGKRGLVLDATSRIIVHVIDTNGADVTWAPLRLWGSNAEPLVNGMSSSTGRLAMSLPPQTTTADRLNLRVEVQPWLAPHVELPVAAEDFVARREVQIVVPVTGAIDLVLGAGFEQLDGHAVAAYLRPEADSKFTAPHARLVGRQPTRIEQVGLNQTLRVGYGLERPGGHAHRNSQLELLEGFVFAGPTEGRPIVEVRLETLPGHLMLRGRLVDPAGLMPEVVFTHRHSIRLRAVPTNFEATTRIGSVGPDPEGVFEWVLSEPGPEQQRVRRLDVIMINSAGNAYATVELPGAEGAGVAEGVIELGDIELLQSPAIVTGRVVDQRGNGLLGASVKAEAITVDRQTGEERVDTSMSNGRGIGEDGSFRLLGAPTAEWWRVEASFSEGFELPQSTVLEWVAFGTEDLVIELAVE